MRRYNEELYQLYAEPEVVKWIISARLRWAGHVVTQLENQHLTCSWVKNSGKTKEEMDLGSGERTESNGCKGLEKVGVGKG
jgi:hypothetical protein